MKVYRVEHKKTGIGPYNQAWYDEDGYDRSGDLSKAHSLSFNTHPIGRIDVPDVNWRDYLCGFTSMRDLFTWFGGWLPVILKNDFHIVVRDVPDQEVKVGKYQVTFRRRFQ